MKIIITFGSKHLQWLHHSEDKEDALTYIGDNEVLYPFIEKAYTKIISDKKENQ